MHHAHTNVIGLGDSSTWKMPFLPRSVYLFIAPLAVPIITPLVAVGENNCSFGSDFEVSFSTVLSSSSVKPPAFSLIRDLNACVSGQLKGQSPLQIARTVACVCVGFLSQYYLLRCVSGLSCGSALMVMLLCRAMFSVTFIHVNIFQVRFNMAF